MGGTVSISIRDCERVDRVRELYHDKRRRKELFEGILEHGTEVENIAHHISPTGGKTLFLADVICYITKRVDPFMTNFFAAEHLNLKSNALSQIVTAAFDYAVKLDGSLKRKQSFVKNEKLNHKFAELRLKYFPSFIAALLFFDHLWEIFDIADDNIDDDSIFLGEFMRARTKIEEIENVRFLREVSEESWKKEFYKIDNGDEQDGWISFLEFARYAAAKINAPDDYITGKQRLILTTHKENTPKRKQSKVTKKQPQPTIAPLVVVDESPPEVDHAVPEPVNDGKPKSMMQQYNERMNAKNKAAAAAAAGGGIQMLGRKASFFKVKPEARKVEDEEDLVEGTEQYYEAKLRKGRETVIANRNAAFRARLKRDEDQIVVESEAAENMIVSTELSNELIDMRASNEKLGEDHMRRYHFTEKGAHKKVKKPHQHHKEVVVGPFSFANIPIHHVKPHSYGAECEKKMLAELETFGKPLHAKENDYVDTRPFSINNLNLVLKVMLDEKKKADREYLERNQEDPLDDSVCNSEADCPEQNLDLMPQQPSVSIANNDRETSVSRAKFRQKIESYIAEGKTNNYKNQEIERPKSASVIVAKTSLDEFDKKQSSSTHVQKFFNNYTDVDKGNRKAARPVKSLKNKYDVGAKSESLALSSQNDVGNNDSSFIETDGGAREGGPYIDDLTSSPHFVRGKMFTDRGNHDKRRFGNVRFPTDSRPRSGHFPSKHDRLQGQHLQYELWDSKRNKALAAKNSRLTPSQAIQPNSPIRYVI